MLIRDAIPPDLPAITAIYNHEVRHAVSTFDTVVRDDAAARDWFEHHPADRWPVLVAELPGTDGTIGGWSSLSRWSPRIAYDRTAEVSVYVDQNHRGQGFGRALLDALVDRAPSVGIHTLIARIEASGTASIQLHEALGFTTIGTMHRVGFKHGRLLDVVLLERLLD